MEHRFILHCDTWYYCVIVGRPDGLGVTLECYYK